MAFGVLFGGLGMLAGAAARLLLGRLRRGARVPPPWCELAVGALWAGAGGWWASGGLAWQWLPLLFGLAWLAVAAGAVDIAHRRLPDALTLPALPVAVLLATPLGGGAVGRSVLGAALLSAVHLAVRMAMPTALGAGDVKLSCAVGAALGAASWPTLLSGTVLASALTAFLALAAGLLRRTAPARLGVPHGPAMLGAAWLVLAAGAVSGAGTGA